MKKLIWTLNYNPFVMGGRTKRPTGAEIPCLGPYSIGRGYEAYVAMTPNGSMMVAEKTTGALVGDSIAQVRRDVASGDTKVMDKQVSEARSMMGDMEVVREQEFYRMIDRAYENAKKTRGDDGKHGD